MPSRATIEWSENSLNPSRFFWPMTLSARSFIWAFPRFRRSGPRRFATGGWLTPSSWFYFRTDLQRSCLHSYFFRPAEMIRIRWKVPHRVAALRGTFILCGAVLCLQQSVLYAPLFCNFTESFSSVCKPVVANPKIINHVLEPSECSASPKRSEHSVSHLFIWAFQRKVFHDLIFVNIVLRG